jgi:4a-hydroxytetrahydrobiopterin dehydratase
MNHNPQLRASLVQRKCKPIPQGTPALAGNEISEMIGSLHGWEYAEGGIEKSYSFANFYETMAFVNALAYIAHQEDHHPDLQVSYSRCSVRFSTHSVGGLSENDFIAAAKIEALLHLEQD